MFGILNNNIDKLRCEILRLDTSNDLFGLEEGETITRQESMATLFSALKGRNSLLAQKAKNRWIKDGDINSKLFQNFINKRRKIHEIIIINVGGQWVEEVEDVEKGVHEYFKGSFDLLDMIEIMGYNFHGLYYS